jgi:RHS repeat-associated protein
VNPSVRLLEPPSGLDYADQRFYASTYGRFNTADPSKNGLNPRVPGSWNRYTYALGDPVNRNDPTGLYACDPDDQELCDDQQSGDGQQDGGGGGANCGSVIATSTCVYESTGVLATATGTSTATCGGDSFWSELLQACDNPLNPTGAAITQTVGQNAGAMNTVIGAAVAPYALLGAGAILAPAGSAGTGLASALSQAVPVIGSAADTFPLAANSIYNVLVVPQAQWSIAMNQAWVGSIISSGQSVALATGLSSAATYNGGIYNGGFTVFGTELGWFFNSGYTVVGSYLAPPVP